jgi:hypothetical protein
METTKMPVYEKAEKWLVDAMADYRRIETLKGYYEMVKTVSWIDLPEIDGTLVLEWLPAFNERRSEIVYTTYHMVHDYIIALSLKKYDEDDMPQFRRFINDDNNTILIQNKMMSTENLWQLVDDLLDRETAVSRKTD